MRKILLLGLCILMLGCNTREPVPAGEQVMEDLTRVNAYLMKKWPDPGQTVITNRERSSNLWTRATYYEGLMALYELDPQEEYYQYAVDWGESHQWQFRDGSNPHKPQPFSSHADNLCAAQTYIDLYVHDPRPERIAYVKSCADSIIRSGVLDEWDWVDALQMVMPVFSKLYSVYKDEIYLDHMHNAFMFTKEKLGGSGLYNGEEGLWWRDPDFLPPYTEPNGEDCYWSRGNGWAYAAMARVLSDMPGSYKHREIYLQVFREMSEALAEVQRKDGFWNVSLHDPDHFGGKELTGTLFFCYGMMWGINNGILGSDYLEPALKAWNAAASEGIRPDGSLAYVQGTGKEPKDGQPVTYDSTPDFEDYGVGAFLLAGTELYKYIINQERNGISSPAEPSEQTYKPWAYWWWMGNSVTREGISENLREYKEAGLGGLHIIPIYGEKGDEENFIDYLSPEWMEMLVHTVSEASKLGMGIDMTTGTGWPFGGPDITFEHSAKTFLLEKVDLGSVENTSEITSGIEGGELVCLTASKDDIEYVDVTALIPGNGSLTTLSPYRTVLALIMRPTRQKVKRAAPGGEGLVMDYFSRDALDHYFRRFMNAFESTVFSSGKVRAFYNDSYEVYGANFTAGFMTKFSELRSYDLTGHLHLIAESGKGEVRARIISDYCETISDLLYTGFTQEWAGLSHQMGMITRNQAHGSPGNLLDLYGACDIPETESFGVSDFNIPGLRKDPDFEEDRFGRPNPLTMKFASSAAHIMGKKLVSSETATWLGDHFKVALSQVKPQIDELFTAGINHIFYHGITYNPPDKPFPGRLFYASTNFGTRSHFWDELPALNQYIASCQEVLQNSEPDNDVLVYFPIHDLWAGKYSDEVILRFDVHHSENWLQDSRFGELVSRLWKEGFCFDYCSDRMLDGAAFRSGEIHLDGGSYKAILVPRSTYMPEGTLKKLKKLAASGACVIFQEDLPESVPGYYDYENREAKFADLKKKIRPLVSISEDISSGLIASGIENEELASLGLSFIRKSGHGRTIYFISNLADEFSRGEISLAGEYATVERSDPLTGKEGALKTDVEDGKTRIDLHLEPGQSCILSCGNFDSALGEWPGYRYGGDALIIDSEWTIKVPGESDDLPAVETERLGSWTEFGGSWPQYSGKVMYSCNFEVEESYVGREMLLDLGDVRETARITLNGKDIGLCWCVPFRIRIPAGILEKSNRIGIEVTNLSFNKVIDLDRRKVPWKQFHEINFVNIRYEPYDASAQEPVASGLLSEIKLIPLI